MPLSAYLETLHIGQGSAFRADVKEVVISDNANLESVELFRTDLPAIGLEKLILTNNAKLKTFHMPFVASNLWSQEMNILQVENNGSLGSELSTFEFGSDATELVIILDVSINGNAWAFGGEGQDCVGASSVAPDAVSGAAGRNVGGLDRVYLVSVY